MAENEDRPIRFGILGCATIARKFCRAVSLLPAASAVVATIGSRSLDKARRFSAAAAADLPPTVRLVGSYSEVLEDSSVDAVYIPLPKSQHVEWAVAAAARGKHVLVEKPAALCVADLDKILEACESSGVQFMDGSMWVHHPRTAEMQRVMRDPDQIGRLRTIHSSCSFLASPDFLETNIRVKPDLDSLGALGDLGWYCVGSILWTVDYRIPTTVVAFPDLVVSSAGIVLSCTAALHWDEGLVATMHCSFLSHVTMDLSAHGSRGTLQVQDLMIPYREDSASFEVNSGARFAELHIGWTRKPEEVKVETKLPQEAIMVMEFARLVKMIRDSECRPSTKWPDICRKTQFVIDAVKRSIETNFELVHL